MCSSETWTRGWQGSGEVGAYVNAPPERQLRHGFGVLAELLARDYHADLGEYSRARSMIFRVASHRLFLGIAAMGVHALGALAASGDVDLSKLPPASTAPVDFETEIRPLFDRACTKCHSAEKQKGGFRLDRKADALAGGDNYAPAVVPHKSAESPLIHFVAGLDPEMKMPPKGEPLTADEVGVLRAWIDAGAPWPDDAAVAKKEVHWSFRPVARPAIPAGENAIDYLVRRTLDAKGLKASPAADWRTLIRRVYFDVVGLPPVPEEVTAFVNESHASDDSYRRLVERLLASPQ